MLNKIASPVTKDFGGQSQRFDGIVAACAASQPAVWKCINPDSDILRNIKQASPQTTTIVRIYTGAPTVDDISQHPSPYDYGYEYARYVYSRVKDPANMDYLEMENEPNDHFGNLTTFISRLNAFMVGFSHRCKELRVKPLGPNFSTGYPECFVKGTDYTLWPNAWQGLTDGLRALRDAGGALGLHEYGAPSLFESFSAGKPYTAWSDAKQRGFEVGRHKAVYECLPADLQSLPLFITEFGVDYMLNGVGGGFWLGFDGDRAEQAPAWMIQQCREVWKRVYATTPQLRGVCQFLWGNDNGGLWDLYDIRRTDKSVIEFTQFFGEQLPPATPPVVNPVPTPLTFQSYPLANGPFPVSQGFGANPAIYQPLGFPGHEGIDFAVPVGTPVLAVADGTIVEALSEGEYGLHVRIQHADGWQTIYAHLSTSAMYPGKVVAAGDKIGMSGNTGNSTGPHLHLTLCRVGFSYTDPNGVVWPRAIFDPTAYLAAVTPTQTPPQTTGGKVTTAKDRIDLAWKSIGVSFNPDAALFKKAAELKVGHPVGNEKYESGLVTQGFRDAFLQCADGDWANAKAYDWLTGELFSVAPVPPSPVPPQSSGPAPYSFPSVLTQIGALGVEGHATAGHPFYRLTGAAVRQGVNATLTVTVLDKQGHPKVNVNVADIFPDGNGEVVFTDGTGTARLQMTENAAFSRPGAGPHTVVLTDTFTKDNDSVPKKLTIGEEESDKVKSLGDWQALHTEVYLQFTEQ